jgi:hypothetical protein
LAVGTDHLTSAAGSASKRKRGSPRPRSFDRFSFTIPRPAASSSPSGPRDLLAEAPTFRRRRGIRGAVAILGPSQSGKTTGSPRLATRREQRALYLCAPLGDETRIGVVFAVLLHDLITQPFDRYNRTGAPLDPRLLVLLDKAAITPLPKLPQRASTVTGAGSQLVTVWQSKAQLDQLSGQDADTAPTNHRT